MEYPTDGKYWVPFRFAICWRADNYEQHILIANSSDISEGAAKLVFYGKAAWNKMLEFFQTSEQGYYLTAPNLHVNDTDLYSSL